MRDKVPEPPRLGPSGYDLGMLRPPLLAASALLAVAVACSSRPPTLPTPASETETEPAAPPQEPTKPPPTLVMKDAPPAPDDCAAQGPDGGLLDRTSPVYRLIEITQGTQVIIEKAHLADSDVTVEARIGGCAHYGASYTIDMPSDIAASERAAHLAAALDLADSLPKRSGATDYLDGIRDSIESAGGDQAKLAECGFARGEMDRVDCHVDTPTPGRVSITLTYDIVL